MIGLLLLSGLVVLGEAQRSPYLGSSVEYPGLLGRFKPNASESGGLGDRFGESSAPAHPSPDGGSSFAQGTLYDKETLDRIAQWPKEKQPYWFINRQQIAQHRGQQAGRNGTP